MKIKINQWENGKLKIKEVEVNFEKLKKDKDGNIIKP